MVKENHIIGCYLGEKLRTAFNSTIVNYRLLDASDADGRPIRIEFNTPCRIMDEGLSNDIRTRLDDWFDPAIFPFKEVEIDAKRNMAVVTIRSALLPFSVKQGDPEGYDAARKKAMEINAKLLEAWRRDDIDGDALQCGYRSL